jgi:hypothetical protein
MNFLSCLKITQFIKLKNNSNQQFELFAWMIFLSCLRITQFVRLEKNSNQQFELFYNCFIFQCFEKQSKAH